VESRAARTSRRRRIWLSRTAWSSMSREAIGCPSATRYLFTPTITSAPVSMRACFCAALASIRNFAQPLSTARVMPPWASTSPMIFHAAAAMSWVSFSIM